MTGAQLDRNQLEVGLRTEMQALEKLRVGTFLADSDAVQLAKDEVTTLVVILSKGESALHEGWHSPTSYSTVFRKASR